MIMTLISTRAALIFLGVLAVITAGYYRFDRVFPDVYFLERDLVSPEREFENPIPATRESVEIGNAVYTVNCVVCHGQAGRGDGPAAKTLSEEPFNFTDKNAMARVTDGDLFLLMSEGVSEEGAEEGAPLIMPAWKDVLTEEQRWHIVNFLRTFSGEVKLER